MKRNLTKRLLALLLVFGMFVPQSAMAASTYCLEVSIEEQENSKKIVTSESAGYLLDSELLVPLVVTAINERYDDDSFARVFASPAMRDIMLEGLRAYDKKDRDSGAAWNTYLEKYYSKVSNLDTDLDLKGLMVDFDSTIGQLEVDKEYQMKFKNEVKGDRKYGTTYVVTVVRRAYSAGTGVQLADPTATGVAGYLNTTGHDAFMSGDKEGTFRPDASVTRAEVAQIFYNLLKDKDVEITATFDDVAADKWYATAVNTLASLNIVTGVGDNKYDPERPITRAEFATIATKFAVKATSVFDFDDVPETHWAYPFVSTAAAYGWITGVGDNKFAPDQAIKRVEAATIVNKMLYRLGDKISIDAGEGRQFPDVTKEHWGYYQIAEATTDHGYTFNAQRTEENWK